ncbi:asparagine synthetase B, partial [bacterium]|nr:asparagine synthetase B [bacterium]
MSAIFGFVNLDGQPASRDYLQVMAGAFECWRHDGVAVSIKGCSGFGQALLVVTPESSHEIMPFNDSETDLFLTAAARLDNRDELLHFFKIATSDRAAFPDGRLIFLSYQKWGEDCPEHLFGDWSFVVWKSRERR